MGSKAPLARRLAPVLAVVAGPLMFLLVGCARGSASEGVPSGGRRAPPGDSSSGGSGAGSSDPGTGPSTTPPPMAPATGAATLRLASKSGGTTVPFTVGYAFRQGDVPQGK